ncbi:MAG TPA: hypothetical protein DDZ84_07565 [Firmicutes bacterium]|nr:hypothetical protein [Bacillota bacterium]
MLGLFGRDRLLPGSLPDPLDFLFRRGDLAVDLADGVCLRAQYGFSQRTLGEHLESQTSQILKELAPLGFELADAGAYHRCVPQLLGFGPHSVYADSDTLLYLVEYVGHQSPPPVIVAILINSLHLSYILHSCGLLCHSHTGRATQNTC